MPTYSSATQDYYTLQLTVTETQVDTANNRSKVSYSLILKTGSTWFDTVKVGYTVKVDGTTVASLSYSDATPHSMSRNSSWEMVSGTTWVDHAADGTKTIAAGKISASLNTATGQIVPNLSLSSSAAWVLTNIPRASSISISGTTTLGLARTITITRASASFKHTLTYTFGNASGTIATKTASTSVSWTPAKNLASQIASGSSSKTGTVTCKTYNGDELIGTTTASFAGVIPASTVSTSAASNLMGTVRKITIDRASANLTHKVTYTFNAASGTIAAAAGASVDWTVPKSLAAQVASGASHRYGTISCETFNGTKSCGTTTVSFRADIPASTITAPAGVWLIGSTQTITISRAASNLTHTLTYSFGSTTDASIGTSVGTSKNWTLPGNMVRQVPAGSVRLVGTIKCVTSNGGAVVGSVSINFTAAIPPDALSADSTSVTLGGNRTFTTTLNDSGATNIKHKLTYTCGSATGTIKNPSTTSETWTVPKSLAGQAAANAGTVSITVTLSTYNGTALVGSKTVTITGTIPASTIAAHTFTIGQSGTVTISRAASNLAHMVYYTFYNEVNQAAVSKTTAETLTWTPKMSLCNQLPNATSGTGTIYVVTYNGTTQIGTAQSAALTLKVPASVVPTDLSITTVIQNTNANLNSWGIAVAGYSTVKSTVSASSAYGSSITERKVTFGGQSGNAALSGGSYVWTSAKLSESGSITPKIAVTDARGRTATKSGSAITVWAYAVPKVTTATAFRSDSGGTKDKQGAYATVKLAGSVTSLGNRNTATMRARYKQASGGSWSGYTTLTNNTAKTISWNLSATVGYVVELSISDTLGNTVTRTISIPADVVTLHLREGGLGVGIGTYSQGANRLDVAWDAWFNGRVLPTQLSSFVASASSVRSNIMLPGRHLASDIMGAADSFPYNAYLEAWLKKICMDHPGATTVTAFWGTATPGSGGGGIIACEIDSAGDLSGGLPNNSSGFLIPRQNSAIIRFGTTGYSFWYRVIYANDPEDGTLTYTNNSLIPEEQFANIGLKKSGKVVTLSTTSGITPSSTSGGTSYTTIGTLPSGFYPQTQTETPIVLRSTTYYSAFIQVTTAGNIRLYKNNTSTNILNFAMSWITA